MVFETQQRTKEFYQEERREATEKAYQKAQETFEKHAISFDDFPRYSQSMKEDHRAKVESLKAKFQEQRPFLKWTEMKGKILEAIIFQHGELSNWFGENASTIKTNDWDDFVNGIDIVVEFGPDEESASHHHLALGIDATFSKRELEHKLSEIIKKIQRGSLPTITYFHSEETDYTGELRQVPTIIIAADEKSIDGLTDLWMSSQNSELARHPFQLQILYEAQEQINFFIEYAKHLQETGFNPQVNYQAIIAKYQQALARINKILKNKENQTSPIKEPSDSSAAALSATIIALRKKLKKEGL